MIPITPVQPDPAATPEEILIPEEISAIFDEASNPNGVHTAAFGPGCVRLILTSSKEVVKEIPWKDANEFGRRLLESSLALTGDAVTSPPTP